MTGFAFGEDLEVDGDEFAVVGFDEVADVGVGDFGAGFGIFPAVVAGGFDSRWIGTMTRLPRGVGSDAGDEWLGGDEGRTVAGFPGLRGADVVAEQAVGGLQIGEVGDALRLGSESRAGW